MGEKPSTTPAGGEVDNAGVSGGDRIQYTLQPVEAPPATTPVAAVTEVDWSPAKSREQMRSILAASLVALLAVVTLLPFLFVATKWVEIGSLDTLLKIVFAPVVGLVGSVVGFYFGAEVASRDRSS